MHLAGCTFLTQALGRRTAAAFVGCSQANVKDIERFVVLGSPAACYSCGSDAPCPLNPVVAVVWASAADVDL